MIAKQVHMRAHEDFLLLLNENEVENILIALELFKKELRAQAEHAQATDVLFLLTAIREELNS